MSPKKIPCKGVSSENGLLLMNRRPRVRKRQSRPRKYFVYMYTLKGNIYLLILCLATMGKVSQTYIFCKCLYKNLIYVFNP